VDLVLSDVIEKDPEIRAPQSEAFKWGFQFFHLANSRFEIPSDAVENLHGSLSIDFAQIRASFR
jgi:hypothetical protein